MAGLRLTLDRGWSELFAYCPVPWMAVSCIKRQDVVMIPEKTPAGTHAHWPPPRCLIDATGHAVTRYQIRPDVCNIGTALWALYLYTIPVSAPSDEWRRRFYAARLPRMCVKHPLPWYRRKGAGRFTLEDAAGELIFDLPPDADCDEEMSAILYMADIALEFYLRE